MRRCLALAALMFFVFPSAALAIQRTDCLYLEPQPAALEAYWSLEGGTQGVTGFRIRHRPAGTTEWSNYVEVPITSAIHFHYTLTGLAPEATEVLVTPRRGETAGWSEKATAMVGSLSPSRAVEGPGPRTSQQPAGRHDANARRWRYRHASKRLRWARRRPPDLAQ